MIKQIKNQFISAKIDSLGAELKEMVDLQTGQNMLWCADTKVWGKTSPNLFPAIGVIKNSGYSISGEFFPMLKHGFCREAEFEVVKSSECCVCFSICNNAETAKMFPYKFELTISYELIDRQLKITYGVSNLSGKTMYFHLGGHTAFSTENKGSMSDYTLEFDSAFEMQASRLGGNPLTVQPKREILQSGNILALSPKLFDDDCIMFEDIEPKNVTLRNTKTGKGVKVSYHDFDHLTVWAARGTDRFVCIEPWTTMPDSYDFNGNIAQKKGIAQLSANCKRNYSMTYEIV